MKNFSILLLSFPFVLLACSKSSFSDPPNKKIFDKATSDFSYTSKYTVKKMKPTSSDEDCSIYDFKLSTSYPQISDDFEVEGHLYRPEQTKKKTPMVVLLPPVGGKNFLDEQMANSLCSNNITVFLPTNDFTGIEQDTPPPVEDHNHAFHRVVSATKAFIQFGKQDSKIKGDKVGVMGASLGGILSSFVIGVLPEVSAAYTIVAGGDVPYILAHSTQSKVVRVKKKRFAEYGFKNNEEYEDWLRQHLDYDPLDFAANVPSEMISMVVSTNDTSVPTNNQFLLLEAFDEPEHETRSSNHFWTIVNTLSGDRAEIVAFFQNRFNKKNTRLP